MSTRATVRVPRVWMRKGCAAVKANSSPMKCSPMQCGQPLSNCNATERTDYGKATNCAEVNYCARSCPQQTRLARISQLQDSTPARCTKRHYLSFTIEEV